MRNKHKMIVICMTAVMMAGCEFSLEKNQDEEPIKQKENFKLAVETEQIEKEWSEVEGQWFLVNKVGDTEIYKDENDKLYVRKGAAYLEKDKASAEIYKNNYMDFSHLLDINKNISEKLKKEVDFKIIENDEVTGNYKVRKEDEKITIQDINAEIFISLNSEKESVGNKEKKRLEEISKEIQMMLYGEVTWLEDIKEMMEYANEQWKIEKDGDLITFEIKGLEYVEIMKKMGYYEDESDYKKAEKKFKNRTITVNQYKTEKEYYLEYIMDKKRKVVETKRLQIQLPSEEEKEAERIQKEELLQNEGAEQGGNIEGNENDKQEENIEQKELNTSEDQTTEVNKEKK